MGKPRITYANVASTVALVMSLGGAAYAAGLIAPNSVASPQVVNNSLKGGDIKDGTVGSVDVKNNSLKGVDIKDGAVGSGDIADGGVAGADLADGAVAGAKLADGSVSGAKIADGQVSGNDLADGGVGVADLNGDLLARSVAAYASIDGFGPTIQAPYSKNVTAVTRTTGFSAGGYCLTVDWAAAGRTPAQQATPVIVTSRSATVAASGDVYNGACPNNGVFVNLKAIPGGSNTDGWVHVLIP